MTAALTKRRNTHRKQVLASLIVENAMSPSPLPAQEIMLQAGYSPSTARTRHSEIMGAVRQEPEVKTHLERLKRIRSKMLDRIEETIEKADFRSAAQGFAILNKSISLLEGKATVRVEHSLNQEEREELEAILIENET